MCIILQHYLYICRMRNFEEILYMPEAENFIRLLDEKARAKVLYNISKAQYVKDPELFKKLDGEIWEFRTTYNKACYRLLAFWDKKTNKVVVCTHGFFKKTQKTPPQEIERAEQLRTEYIKGR